MATRRGTIGVNKARGRVAVAYKKPGSDASKTGARGNTRAAGTALAGKIGTKRRAGKLGTVANPGGKAGKVGTKRTKGRLGNTAAARAGYNQR